MMEKLLYKNLKRYEDAWDKLTKKFINNLINQWQMQLEEVVEKGGGHI